MALPQRAGWFQGTARPRRYIASKTCPCSANGTARRGRRTARRIFLVALFVSLHPPNHRQPPTAFGTDNSRSALVAGTALHAPKQPLADARASGVSCILPPLRVRLSNCEVR